MTLELRSYSQEQKIPGPPVVPLLGSLPFVEKHQHLAFTRLGRKYGDVLKLNIFGKNVIVLNGLETIRQAFLRQSEDFAGRPDLPIVRTVVKGNNVAARDYSSTWKRHREIVVNALHMFLDNKNYSLEQKITEDAVELANIFLSHSDKAFDPSLDIYISLSNVMSNILFGKKYERNNPDFLYLTKMFQMAGRVGMASMRFIFAPVPPGIFQFTKYVTSVGERLIGNTLSEHKKSYNPENLRCVVDALLKAVGEINDSEKETLGLTETLIVEGTAQEFMGAGTQAVPVIAWGLLYMIAYPEIQAQVQQELDAVIGKDQVISYSDRVKLPFTQACIHEIWRHAPYFPTAIPHAATRDTSINGYFIPKSTTVYANLYGLTRDPRYWEEPEQFNPHRFLSETGEIREELLEQFYPFGLGKRKCFAESLGRQEVFLFFTNLIHRCKFAKVPGAKLSFESQTGAVAMPKERYRVIAQPRF